MGTYKGQRVKANCIVTDLFQEVLITQTFSYFLGAFPNCILVVVVGGLVVWVLFFPLFSFVFTACSGCEVFSLTFPPPLLLHQDLSISARISELYGLVLPCAPSFEL